VHKIVEIIALGDDQERLWGGKMVGRERGTGKPGSEWYWGGRGGESLIEASVEPHRRL
jgi:hypothetical protein